MAKERQNYLNPYSPVKNKVSGTNTIESNKEYFSGANCHVYFGDVYVEELESIAFSLEENVAPIFGFNSYTFDSVLRGNRYVSGQFTVNFTENGYIQTILDLIATKVTSIESQGGKDQGYGSSANYYKNDKRRNNTIKNIAKGYTGANYNEYISSLQDNYWGQPNGNHLSNVGLQKDENPFWYGRQNGINFDNPLKENGFNILIDFNPETAEADFENCLKNMGTGVSFYNTFRTIIGVHIISSHQELTSDGRVIRETFNFIARDLDGDIQSSSLRYNFRHGLIGYDVSVPEGYNPNTKEPYKPGNSGQSTDNNGIIIGSGGHRPIQP